MRQGVNMFVDKTNDLEEFENNIYKSPGKFRKMLNKHCWPVIRCPVGCWQFIDKCRTLQFHHFISRHLDIKISSEKKLTASFKKDLPETSKIVSNGELNLHCAFQKMKVCVFCCAQLMKMMI